MSELVRLPDHDRLEAELNRLLRGQGVVADHATLIDRRKNIYSSSFPSEIVTLETGNEERIRLLCKYSRPPDRRCGGALRGDLAYEAGVYRKVLRPLGVSTPRCYGTCTGGEGTPDWLVLEFMQDAVRVNQSPDEHAIIRAAEWLGRFHEASAGRTDDFRGFGLYRFGPDYYRQWPRRTVRFAGANLRRFSWLAELCRRFEDRVDEFAHVEQIVIHGEYYPCNILLDGSHIRPVDWESCALAAGVIDLATLTDGWPEDGSRRLEQAYRRTRWPSSTPSVHEASLDLGRCYVHFRWLGNLAEWATDDPLTWRYDALRRLGERLGLI